MAFMASSSKFPAVDADTDMREENSESEEENWADWDEVESNQIIICLFCPLQYGSAEDVIRHCYSDHDVDIRLPCREDDAFSYIRLINYIRKKKPSPGELVSLCSDAPWNLSDEYLIPVNPEDPILQFDIDDLMELTLDESINGAGGDTVVDRHNELVHKLKEAEERARKAEEQLHLVLQDLNTMRNVAQNFMLSDSRVSPGETSGSCSSESSVSGHTGSRATNTAIKELTEAEDSAYFQPYSHYGIHQEMLQDQVRTGAYRDFIMKNKELFRGKVVLDIGCGTGILSLFAARAGAKQVFAVDQSEIYVQAIDIVRENKLDDVISVIHGKVEEIQLPVDKVDIIISEWMGYFLLFESMLDTIIYARDQWLSDTGSVYPDLFYIQLQGSGDKSLYTDHVEYWDDVYGFTMTSMRDLVIKEAAVDDVRADLIITESAVVKEIDTNDISIEDVDFSSEFELHATRDGDLTAIVAYFDTIFKRNAKNEVMFSTSPSSKSTHWKQTLFLLKKPLPVKTGERIQGRICVKKNRRDPRSLKVRLTLNGSQMKFVVE